MRLAKKFAVPQELALLYEFLNSADLRSYLEKGIQHVPSDELGTAAHLEEWMRNRGLLAAAEMISAQMRKCGAYDPGTHAIGVLKQLSNLRGDTHLGPGDQG